MLTGKGGSGIRVLAAAAILFAGVSTLQAAAPDRAAAAQTDLSFISSTTWTADPAAARIHVQVSLTATSHTVDTESRRYFYDEIQLVLPPSASASTATSATGEALPVTVQSASGSGVIVVVGLGQRLYSGQSGSVELQFDLVDPGGSPDRDLRISRNLFSFPVWAFGSPGTPGSSVTVVFPSGFTVQEEFGGLTRSVFGSGEVVFASGTLDDSTDLSAWFTAVQPVPPSDFRSRSVMIGPLHVALRYWADDPGWADRVELVLRAGYPILSDLIGLDDPITTTLTVNEASTQEIGGFSGSYDQASGSVQISYFADPFVVLHEAAHIWFNGSLATDRWIQEAFASYYADQAVRQLGLVDHAPVLTARMSLDSVPLNDWVTPGQPSSVTEAYLYGATLEVAKEIAATAGQDGLRKVWSAARSHSAAYQPTHGPNGELVLTGAIGWRELLDLLEQNTGQQYESIWSKWIVDPEQAPLLQRRAAALSAYADAQRAAGAWDLPPEIRRAMVAWQFDSALTLMSQARTILVQRDEIATLAPVEGTTPPTTLEASFEVSGLAVASAEATRELAALGALAAARRAESESTGGTRVLGLLGADPEADLAAAQKAFASGDMAGATSFATSAKSAWDRANGTGQARIFGAVALLAGLLLLLVVFAWTWGNRRPHISTVAAAAQSPDPAPPAGISGSAPVGEPSGQDGGDDPEESAYDLLQRGHHLMTNRHNAQAAVVLERAARAEPGKGSILEALGRAYFNSGQHARAIETFEALLEIDPSAHYGHFAAGLSLARLGRTQEARTHMRLAAALDPASETYRNALEKLESASV
ncbi:MAG TPA: tetratricopeptide repeat protein [Candidatus Limnocylindrales bacterium]|nr:tetratricopeptide repeat protein [Candidatus Limnocylindrales bacterium]